MIMIMCTVLYRYIICWEWYGTVCVSSFNSAVLNNEWTISPTVFSSLLKWVIEVFLWCVLYVFCVALLSYHPPISCSIYRFNHPIITISSVQYSYTIIFTISLSSLTKYSVNYHLHIIWMNVLHCESRSWIHIPYLYIYIYIYMPLLIKPPFLDGDFTGFRSFRHLLESEFGWTTRWATITLI